MYHLYGTLNERTSIVLTERDYFNYLIYLSKESNNVWPAIIRKCLASNTYLFVGFRLEDTNFLAMFLSITSSVERLQSPGDEGSIAVQFTSTISPTKNKKIEQFLNNYTNNLFKIRVHLGNVDKFFEEFKNRMW